MQSQPCGLRVVGLILGLIFAVTPAFAADVAISAIEGPGGGTASIKKLQRELDKLRRIQIVGTRRFNDRARALGVDGGMPDGERYIREVVIDLRVDAVVYGRIEKVRGKRHRRDRTLRLWVYNGADGAQLGEYRIRVAKGRFTTATWRKAARTIAPDIRRGRHEPPVNVIDARGEFESGGEPIVDVVSIDREPANSRARRPVSTRADTFAFDDLADKSRGHEIFRVNAGLTFLIRSFDYQVKEDSIPFREGGINYDVTFAPGLALNLEIFPFAAFGSGLLDELGLAFAYQRSFLETQQEVTRTDGTEERRTLETRHQHIQLGLVFDHPFGDGPAAPIVRGGLGLGFLSFVLQGNPEYSGAEYTWIGAHLGGRLPLGTRYAMLDGNLHVVPVASLGDTVEEVGGDAAVFGWGVDVGVTSAITDALTTHAGIDFTSFGATVSGTGRDGRKGDSTSDTYLNLRVLAGYAY